MKTEISKCLLFVRFFISYAFGIRSRNLEKYFIDCKERRIKLGTKL